ncbi:DMT family transporter [Peptoniphilus sp. oral taxon 386]|uniref:DMT family transporter n=1 Tax=Peptoniphilus sp. oral taxon 386 TaxID=652713 RepID=UPI0001DA9A5F|nr:DMT family transporter [Peptoniphilus sp. oral taxon 386]EFI41913.1 putative membrane protein [Peptoniphilus sp. oral taxon 386 str. F0131]
MQKNSKIMLRGYIMTIIGATFWGFSGTCGQYLMSTKGLDAKIIVNTRLIFAGLILILLSLYKNKTETFKIFKNKKDTLTLIAFGIFGMLFCQFSYLITISKTNAPTATVLQFLSSIFIVVGVCIKEMRAPKIKEISSIVLALLGTVVLATHLDLSTLVISSSGLFWGILAAFSVVIYTLLPINILKKYSSSVVTGFGMFIGGIVITFLLQPWKFSVNFDMMTILGLIAMIVFGTVLAFNCFLTGVSIIGPVRGSLIAGLEAVSSLLFSIILLKESFMMIDLFGMLLILMAVTVLSFNK